VLSAHKHRKHRCSYFKTTNVYRIRGWKKISEKKGGSVISRTKRRYWKKQNRYWAEKVKQQSFEGEDSLGG